jgi:hypothetical protein
MAHRRSLGCARDDKKERVAERERTVAKGPGVRRGGGEVDKQPLLRENQKKSQPLRMTACWGLEIQLVGYAENTKRSKSHRLLG